MATIDDKVVAMSFESSKFERGVANVISSLDKLKKALHFPDAGKGLKDIDAASKKLDLSHIAKSVDDIKNKFGALSVAALAVFATIATRAVQTGAALAKSFTLDPIIQGFQEYETKLNSVQTILSNTAAAGTKLEDVNKVLAELNEYADKTIYSFSEMTRNIGTFTAAGVDLETATSSIKGIANLAAISGSNSQQASTAMYQLSQAISAGRVTLMDWNSVVNAGMGGTVFQRALAQTAEHIGTLDEGAVQLTGKMKNVTIAGESFRQSLSAAPGEESWLTSEVLTKTLEQLSGDYTDAELRAQGFTEAQIKSIQAQAQMAEDAATQVKTFSQLISTTKEALGSGWADTWQLIFGDFGEAKRLFTGISNTINDFIQKSADARNKILKDWKDLGGRTLLISSLKNAFKTLGMYLEPVKDAFRDIFPAKTGQDLFNLTKSFSEFIKQLKPSPETIDNLRRTFRGLFALLSIGKQIIGGIFTVFGKMLGAIGDGSGGFLDLTGTIGDFLVSIDAALKKGGGLNKFFETLGDILALPIELISELAGAIADLFSTKGSGGIGGLTEELNPFAAAVEAVSDAWSNFIDGFGDSESIFENVGSALSDLFSGLGDFIASSIGNINWDNVLAVINTGLFAGLVLLFKKFFGKGSLVDQLGGLGGGIISNIAGSFKALEGSLSAMQQNIKAKTLKEIAIAIGILAVSLLILSTIEPEKMKTAMTGLVVAFGILLGAMAALDKVAASPGFLKLPFIAGSLIILSVAIGLLAISVKGLSTMDWEELAKGLSGVTVLLAGLTVAAGPLSRSSAGLISAGVGITALAIAMKILASAVKDFGGLSWTELAKGMGAIAVALVAIGGAARLFPPNMIMIGVGLVAVAVSLKLIASAVETFANLSWEEIGKGMAAIAGALVIIGVAMKLMPPTMALQATGLLIVAGALTVMGKALEQMGGMSMEEIGKGLGTLAGALIILGVALHFMQGAIGGAVALGVAAAGIALLTPALVALGNQSWPEIIKGLVTLAAALAILGIAGVALTPVIPALLGLGAALLLLGAGLALAGAGIALIGIGLSAIAVAGPTAVAILLSAIEQLLEKLPQMAAAVVQAVVAAVMSLAEAAPQIVTALGKLLVALADAVILAAPKLGDATEVLIREMLETIRGLIPDLVRTGIALIMGLLTGIRNNIGKVVTVATDIIVNFLNGLAKNIPRILAAGVNLISKLIEGLGRSGVQLARAGADALIDFLEGLATAIEEKMPEIMNAGVKVGVAIVEGMIRGIAAMAGTLMEKAKNLAKDALGAATDFLGITSPSKAFYEVGKNITLGMINGLEANSQDVARSAEVMSQGVIDAVESIFEITSPSKVMKRLGKMVGQGFVDGLTGTAEDIKAAFDRLNQGIGEELRSAQDKLKQARQDLRQAKEDKDSGGIRAAKAAIARNEAVIKALQANRKELAATTKADRAALVGLAHEYDDVTKKLDAAKSALAAAQKARDDYAASTKSQYADTPDINTAIDPAVALERYKQGLANQAAAVETYSATLDQLRALGLDDKTYQKLLSEGTADQKFASALLAGGKSAVDDLNALDSRLDTAAGKIADTGATELHKAGIATAQGFVDGFATRKGEIEKEMSVLATTIVRAIKKALKIKSPSQVFMELGELTVQGFAEGITGATNLVADAAEGVSASMMDAMKDSMGDLSTALTAEIDAEPTITPVLDLSQVQQDADSMKDMIGNLVPITAASSYRQAASISADELAAADKAAADAAGTNITFEQHNHSPEALSTLEIYRQTNNQLSQAKLALT